MSSSKQQIELHSRNVTFSFLKTGDIYKMTGQSVLINQLLTNELDGSLNNIYLRIHEDSKINSYPLLGIRSESTISYSNDQVIWTGKVNHLKYKVVFTLSADDIWFWDIFLEGNGETVDLIYGQDLGLADKSAVQSNEAYTSQYIDHRVFKDQEYGYIVCSRQNMPQAAGHPYIQQGSLTRAVSYSTDGFQFFGLSYKETNQPEILSKPNLANEIYQYEFAYTSLQSEKVNVNGMKQFTFYGIYKEDHPETIQTAEYLEEVKDVREAVVIEESPSTIQVDPIKLVANLGEPLKTLSMTDKEIAYYFPNRHEEEYQEGQLLSFFTDTHEHVVLKEKELLVERPHGHILMSGNNHWRNERVLTTTSYMYGVLNSQLLVGNTTFNKMLSNTRNPLNLMKTSGQRLYIEIDGIYRLLSMPSMFEMGFNYVRWYFKTENDLIIITNYTYVDSPQLKLHVRSVQNKPYRFIMTNQVIINDIEYELPYRIAEKDGIIIFQSDSKSLNASKYPYLCYKMMVEGTNFTVNNESVFFETDNQLNYSLHVLELEQANNWSITIQGFLDGEKFQDQHTNEKDEIVKYRAYLAQLMNGFQLSNINKQEQLNKVNDLVWWYTHNMLVHYSVPHGLEQYGGAAWGTRDVSQGPVEYFIATQNYESVREILKIVYSHQYQDDGNWPQWFMFDKYYQIQQEESHGDIIVWPLKIMSDYLLATDHYEILNEKVPFTKKGEFDYTSETYTLYEHVEKAIEYIKNHFLHDTKLSSYGDGDWDDTLQPANKQLKQYMVSSWTVALTYQTIKQLSEALAKVDKEKASNLENLAHGIKADFQKFMLQTDVLPGFLYMEEPDKPELMLHPTDTKTGIHYRLIPMTQSIISELFDMEQAEKHYKLIKEHLYFPDGVRLMNKPAKYTGGNSIHFKRAEQAANFGREIGLQYVHAHIRFVEAMAKLGNAEEVWSGLETINPIGIQHVVPNAERRQSNAYFSSSDGKFNHRYEAQTRFNELREGKVQVKAGWRIYSSGPGIFINQLISNVLGIRFSEESLIIDPVLPNELDGLEFRFAVNQIPVTFIYSIKGQSVCEIKINGQGLNTAKVNNPYRSSGVKVNLRELRKYLLADHHNNKIVIFLK